MSVSDPVLYPEPHDTPDGLRQEVLRARTDVAQTVEALSRRASPRRLARPATAAPAIGGIVVGLAAFAALRRVPVVRAVAWIGGLGAALATIFVARRGVRAIEEAPVVPIAVDDQPYDVVTVLIEQHQRIEAAFAEVLEAVGQHRVEAFAALVDLLRYHERAERDLVHPLLRPFAAEVADARLAEEDAADRALASLVSRGVADPAFEAGLIRLQRLVSDHAAHEEAREFPLLRSDIAPARLRDVAGQVRWTS